MWVPLLLIVYLIYVVLAVPAAAAAAFAFYAIVIPGTYLLALTRVLASRPVWLPEWRRAPKVAAGADPAVPQYFYRQAAANAGQAVRLAYEGARGRWSSGSRKIIGSFGAGEAMVTAPLGIGAAAGMAAGTLFGTLAAGACAVTCLPSSACPRGPSAPQAPRCAPPTPPCSGSGTSGCSARSASSECPMPVISAPPPPRASACTATCGLAGSASCGAAVSAASQ